MISVFEALIVHVILEGLIGPYEYNRFDRYAVAK